MQDVLLDTLTDTLKLVPFLFVAFLIIEFVEHKLTDKNKTTISKAGRFGPLWGSLLGAIPQCGFSVMATNLYAIRIISLGTLISIFLATSDEMLPILLSHGIRVSLIVEILAIKVVIGMICGFIIDLVLKCKKQEIKYEICNDDHCDCEHGIFKSSLKHTLIIILFIGLISLILNIIMHTVGINYLSKLLLKNSIFGSTITALIGLIPSCAASVVQTELYLKGAISFGAMIGGLLTGSGVSILVLFKVNKDIKENIKIIGILYLVGVLSGVIIDIINNIVVF